ncbi:ABC transporter permease [Serinibacter salmoneus]|uniref:Transport permease protein n=1 Tax=Serinibacter salmoneus TaxID=556530 RepID=A0A2A9D3C5_9MICO|nr:ABC transporter permease [Serinibacter salmoneus]PFG21207.1 ABC-2 type transport system permease protein [Serinibacter salmoneus]
MSTHALTEVASMSGRTLKHITRSPDSIISTALMPIAFMLLFVYVFGGAIQAPGDSYVTYLLPGILVVTIASGVAYTSYRLFLDVQGGIAERFRSLPIWSGSFLWSHVTASLAAIGASLVLVIGVALLMGFRSGASVGAWLAVIGILTLLALALIWIAVIAGLAATSVDGASAFSYPLILLPFVSSAFVPTDSMPAPVQWFAEHQPVTAIVDTLRALLEQQSVGSEIWVALAWCVGILAAAWGGASVLYRRRRR